ncbi:MAG TPA: hypothetical protein VGO51_10150, partial [Burkholderiaceae bacterium]|nr:hypothetical protein [Burkholderiaceae bacterium]
CEMGMPCACSALSAKDNSTAFSSLQREAVLSALSPSGGSVCQMTDYIKLFSPPRRFSAIKKLQAQTPSDLYSAGAL